MTNDTGASTPPQFPEDDAPCDNPKPVPEFYLPMFGEPVSDWYRWFAWRPVETIDRGWRWLRPVWKRRVHKHPYLDGGAVFWFQHAVAVDQ